MHARERMEQCMGAYVQLARQAHDTAHGQMAQCLMPLMQF